MDHEAEARRIEEALREHCNTSWRVAFEPDRCWFNCVKRGKYLSRKEINLLGKLGQIKHKSVYGAWLGVEVTPHLLIV